MLFVDALKFIVFMSDNLTKQTDLCRKDTHLLLRYKTGFGWYSLDGIHFLQFVDKSNMGTYFFEQFNI